MSERITCQKEAILNYLRSVRTHPTAREVYLSVKKQLPRISLGTVYRNLNLMKERGEIIELPGEPSRYDAETSPHIHFICENCGRAFDILDEAKKELLVGKEIAGRKIPAGIIKNYQISFFGVCQDCIKKQGRKFNGKILKKENMACKRKNTKNTKKKAQKCAPRRKCARKKTAK